MVEFLNQIMPNVMGKLPELWKCTGQTLSMMLYSGIISFVIGIVLGVVLTVTKKGGILQNKIIYGILDKIINIFRSIPFVILMAALLPFTRALVGTAIGTKGAMVPLVFGTVPFFTRQVETALAELDQGLIEAAQAMGNSPFEIIFRVYLKESIPALTRGTTITAISLVGLTAMAGAVGGGGTWRFRNPLRTSAESDRRYLGDSAPNADPGKCITGSRRSDHQKDQALNEDTGT